MTNAFVVVQIGAKERSSSQWTIRCRATESGSSTVKDDDATPFEDEIRSMRVREIKIELERLKIPTVDIFDKEELVRRLVEARRTKHPKPSSDLQDNERNSSRSTQKVTDEGVIVSPLYFTTVDAGRSSAGVEIQSSDKPFATILIHAWSKNNNDQSFQLHLLLDTACSGLVLRPSVVKQHNLPKLSTPVTMTGAGGTVGATGLTEIEKFTIQTLSDTEKSRMFGPISAAVQDIGGLPSSLDGIIGLSFLNRFSCVEMDFSSGTVTFFSGENTNSRTSEHDLLGRATMGYIPTLGLYSVEVYLGDKGPVRMLVDSGASSTFLNWKGVADLGLSRDDKLLQRQRRAFGAIGSDNVAMELTHRVTVGSTLKIGSSGRKSEPGISLAENSRNLRIEVGDIAILEQLKSENVGGILGVDAFMRCSKVRFRFGNGPKKNEIEMYK
ncbi:aspartyl protease [Nitzschia inconspicua]|uniref:Aspartyl protease n=1 Tax=Nitzschia inconspicua TaxID=303405 RepID=A0A9K3M0A2_9STRA|nr:aspartyl protease [Nitzschia inconspicua]